MSDYSVNWYLNNTLLPLISEDTTDFLIESNKCSLKELPHTFTTQKGPEPGKLVVVLPYGELGVFLPNITSGPTYVGNNTLKIVWKDLKPKPPLINLPDETIEIKNLYVTNISETITHVNNIDSNDLVIVTLHDVRYFLNKDSPFNKTKFSSDIMSSSDTVAERIWEEYFKDMYKSKSLVSTNKFHPEVTAGVDTNYVQFSVDNFQSDWKTFNEACNRTENVFFIDYNGDPVIQANSFSVTDVLSTTPSYPPKQFLDDSVYSHTLDNEARNNLFNDWETTVGNFWSTESKSSFHEVENNPTGIPSISKSNINLFPLSVHRYSNSLENNKTDYISIIEAYESEINDTFDIEVVRVCHNGTVYVELNSQVTQVTYTNNSVGVFTYFDCEFRHAIPFYEFNDKFNDEFIPTLHANLSSAVYPRNYDSAVSKGFNMIGTSWYQKGADVIPPAEIDGKTNFMYRGFYGEAIGSGKISTVNLNEVKTNSSIFENSSGIKVTKSGYYKISCSGTAKLPLVGIIPETPERDEARIALLSGGFVQTPEGIQQNFAVDVGSTFTFDIPIDDVFPQNLHLRLIPYYDSANPTERDRADFASLHIDNLTWTQPDNAPGYTLFITVAYSRNVYQEDPNSPGLNLFGGIELQEESINFGLEVTYTPSIPEYSSTCDYLGAREEFKLLVDSGSGAETLGRIKFPDEKGTLGYKRDLSSLVHYHGSSDNVDLFLSWESLHSTVSWNLNSFYISSGRNSAKHRYNGLRDDLPLEPTTTSYEIFKTPFHIEKVVKINSGDAINLSLTAKSPWSVKTTETPPESGNFFLPAAGTRFKTTSVVGPVEVSGNITVEFVSETNPVNQSYDI